MFNNFVELCSNIILESLDDVSKNKINDLIKKLESMRDNKRMNRLHKQLYEIITIKIRQLESFGLLRKRIKVNSEFIKYIINNHDRNIILSDENYNELCKIHKRYNIPDPTDIKNKDQYTSGLYIYNDKNENYIFWNSDEPIENYFVEPDPIYKPSTELVRLVFNKCCTVKGDIVGNGELLADHIFKDFKMRTNRSNNYSDGTYKNIDVDIKHTNRFKGGIHNNSNGSPTNDHSKGLRPNTLYIVFDFRSDNLRWAFIYYKGSEK